MTKQQDIYDRAGLVQMVDLERGRSMLKQLLAMQVAGFTSGADVNWDDVCARYDAILQQGSLR